MTTRSGVGACLVLALISFWTLFFRIGALPFSGSDEPRYARIAQEMQEQGRWVTPVLEGSPWLEKPPLYYWITIPVFSVFGAGETTARLGTAALGLVTSLTVLWVGTALWSRLAGFLSASILLTSFGFAGYGRSASTDVPLTAFLTITLGVFAVAAVRRVPSWKLWIAYAALGLAALAKGPVALLLVAGTAALFWFLDERGGVMARWRPAGLIIAGAVALPWYWLAFVQNGFSFISIFFINHNLTRYISDIHHHSEPFYYYLPIVPAMLFPWSGWFPVLFRESPRRTLSRWRAWDPGTLFLACWIAFPLVFFSFSTSKLAGYVLPIVPPLALLLGRSLAGLWSSAEHRRAPGAAALYLTFSAALAIAAPIAFQKFFDGEWQAGLWISCAVMIPAVPAFLYGRLGRWRPAVAATAAQGMILVVTVVVAAVPVIGNHYSTRGIARAAMESLRPGESIVTYRFFHHTLNYYTGYRIAEGLLDPPSVDRYLRNHENALVVTGSDRIPELMEIGGLSVTVLQSQSKFRLLRIERARP